MKEQDLIDLGFEKKEVPTKESGKNSHHYYTYRLTNNFSLISCGSNEVTAKSWSWFVEIVNDFDVRFYDKKELKTFMNLIEKNKGVKLNSKQ